MKRLLSLALCAVCLSSLPARAGFPVRQPGEVIVPVKESDLASVLQSLEKVLRQKGYVRLPGFKTWQRLTSWKAEGCQVSYVITDEGVNTDGLGGEPTVDVGRHSRIQFRLDLGDLDPQLVEVNQYKSAEGGSVSYRTEGEKKLIKFEARHLSAADWRSRGWLVLKDKESLNEVAALLKQAVGMCRK